MSGTLLGTIHGKTIQLDLDPGLTDGAKVAIVVLPVSASGVWGEGIRNSAGALADDWGEEDDLILAQIQNDRRRSVVPDCEP